MYVKSIKIQNKKWLDKKIMIKNILSNNVWHNNILNEHDPNTACDNLTIIQQIIDSVAPEHVVTVSAKNRFTEPWMRKGLIKSGQIKLNYYKKTLVPNCLEADHDKYKQYRNKYKSKKTDTKQYYNDKCRV